MVLVAMLAEGFGSDTFKKETFPSSSLKYTPGVGVGNVQPKQVRLKATGECNQLPSSLTRMRADGKIQKVKYSEEKMELFAPAAVNSFHPPT